MRVSPREGLTTWVCTGGKEGVGQEVSEEGAPSQGSAQLGERGLDEATQVCLARQVGECVREHSTEQRKGEGLAKGGF